MPLARTTFPVPKFKFFSKRGAPAKSATRVILLRGISFCQAPHEGSAGPAHSRSAIACPARPVLAPSTARIAEPDLPEHSVHKAAFRRHQLSPIWAYPRAIAAMLHGSVGEHAVADICPEQVVANDSADRCQDGSNFLFGAGGGENFDAWRADGPMRWECPSAASISQITRYGAHGAREGPNRTVLGATFANWLSSQCRQSPDARRRVNSAESR